MIDVPLLKSVPNDLGKMLGTSPVVLNMERMILHWTAGTYVPNVVDKHSYHYLILPSGELQGADHGVFQNARGHMDSDYAQHVRGMNSGSIGVSMCGMAGATPSNYGKFPLSANQWHTAVAVAAELARLFSWPVDRHHILGHFEVDDEYHILQSRWDPFVAFPSWDWAAGKKPKEIAEIFRQQVREKLSEVK